MPWDRFRSVWGKVVALVVALFLAAVAGANFVTNAFGVVDFLKDPNKQLYQPPEVMTRM